MLVVPLHPDLQRTTGEWVGENEHIGHLLRTEFPAPVVEFEFCALILISNPWLFDGRSIAGLGYFFRVCPGAEMARHVPWGIQLPVI